MAAKRTPHAEVRRVIAKAIALLGDVSEDGTADIRSASGQGLGPAIARQTGLSTSVVTGALKRMEDDKEIEREMNGKRCYAIIVGSSLMSEALNGSDPAAGNTGPDPDPDPGPEDDPEDPADEPPAPEDANGGGPADPEDDANDNSGDEDSDELLEGMAEGLANMKELSSKLDDSFYNVRRYVARLEAERDRLKEQNRGLEREVADLEEEIGALRQSKAEAAEQAKQLAQQLAGEPSSE